MLNNATYLSRPHSKPRTHAIPIEVIEKVTGKKDNCALDGTDCFFEIFIKTKGGKMISMPPVILRPSSGGEVYVGKKTIPEYPEKFAVDDFLIIRLTVLRMD